jgi:hypothetical protein
MIPNGYVLDETPSPEIITLGDQQISYSYQTQKNNATNTVLIVQRITVKQTLFPAIDYKEVRDFWALIAGKNNAQLVLKRVDKN